MVLVCRTQLRLFTRGTQKQVFTPLAAVGEGAMAVRLISQGGGRCGDILWVTQIQGAPLDACIPVRGIVVDGGGTRGIGECTEDHVAVLAWFEALGGATSKMKSTGVDDGGAPSLC